MARKRTVLGEDLGDLLQRNGKLLTGFAALLIIVVGITLIENPEKWWVSLMALGVFFLSIFLFLNAKAFVKAVISILIVLILGSYGFRLGAEIDPSGIAGSLWMTTIFSSYFINLCISFLKPSSKSRWGVATLTVITQFSLSLILILAGANSTFSLLLPTVLSFAIFNLIYFFSLGARLRTADMPIIGFTEDEAEAITKAALAAGYGAWERGKENQRSVIVWNEKTAFQLIPISLEQKFGLSGGRRNQLVYKGRPINSWLLDLTYKLTPIWGIANADIMTVLLDEDNKNGKEARVIGVSMADTNKKIPVGVFPAKKFLTGNRVKELLLEVEKEYSDFVIELSPKQVNLLDSHLPDEEDQE